MNASRMKRQLLAACAALSFVGTGAPADEMRYTAPAKKWEQALPLGNGRLGAMVFGLVEEERLQLNEDTIWTGGPLGRGPYDYGPEQVRKMRELVFAGKAKEAAQQLPRSCGRGATYQPFGDLLVKSELPAGKTEGYARSLSLDDAVARSSFTRGGVRFSRETFTSFTDGVVVHHLSASEPGRISFEARVASPHGAPCVAENGELAVRGATGAVQGAFGGNRPGGFLRFEGRVAVRTKGGEVTVADGRIRVRNADEATLYTAIETSYRNFRDVTDDPKAKCTAAIARAMKTAYADAKAAHTAFYRRQADRCSLRLGDEGEKASMPVGERIDAYGKSDDPSLAALFFRFGRYLLISGSQPGTQPINLQGIWNPLMNPPWRSNCTLNINEPMHYWAAETVGLGELAEPVWRMCDELAVTGADCARDMYGAEGWMAHHNTDPWRFAAPCGIAQACAIWPMGGTWMSLHIWYHWLYTHDRGFLAKHYATLKGATDFLLSLLARDPVSGKLTICPSNSPEQGPPGAVWPCAITRGATMSNCLARDLLTAVAEATEVLDGDKAYAQRLRDAAAAVEPLRVGRWGQLQEWNEDFDDPRCQHRHTSHLYAAYPSNQITPETPELFEAAKVSLRHRGEESVGWALAWRMCLWARLGDGDLAYRLFRSAMRIRDDFVGMGESGGVYSNLLSCGPPFQCDGNFGCVAGIAELILQTHRGAIDLLPALPRAWPEGKATGFRAPHGFTLDFEWTGGRLVRARVTSDLGEPCKVRYAGRSVSLKLAKGESVTLAPEDFK